MLQRKDVPSVSKESVRVVPETIHKFIQCTLQSFLERTYLIMGKVKVCKGIMVMPAGGRQDHVSPQTFDGAALFP